jgi:hypothetical protein
MRVPNIHLSRYQTSNETTIRALAAATFIHTSTQQAYIHTSRETRERESQLTLFGSLFFPSMVVEMM